jgi:hypothetical protein
LVVTALHFLIGIHNSRLAGYEDVKDAERLGLDPTMRTVVCGRAKDNTAASTSEMARFETETLLALSGLPMCVIISVSFCRNAVCGMKVRVAWRVSPG